MLTAVGAVVLVGLVVMSLRLAAMQDRLDRLRTSALPRLVKLSQLSQEASASSSIAPALSARPTRFEFETLLSRINDKDASQRRLIDELAAAFEDETAARLLRETGAEFRGNLARLTEVVSAQIATAKRLEGYGDAARRTLAALDGGEAQFERLTTLARQGASDVLRLLLDTNRARFSRNWSAAERTMERLTSSVAQAPAEATRAPSGGAIRAFSAAWSENSAALFEDKEAALTNAFRVKALVEENSLIANRLLGAASNAFWRTSEELESQIRLVNDATRFTMALILAVIAAFALGNLFVWRELKSSVFTRLNRMRDGLRAFAETRDRGFIDERADEIGEIAGSLGHYMAVIEEREAQLAEKTRALEQLSSQLAKYLSPQIYDSIFSGRQEVKLASTRKKLTIFFSDIVGFTETADRLESEEVTELLNRYLTEMSRIALDHGATIDKYVGDAILIFFGDPETRGARDDALACVRMAIAMRERLRDLQDDWRRAGIQKPLTVRMGIHTGFCTVGNFGSEDRLDYTIVGGAVNAASRLEDLAPPGEILISYETFALVQDEIRCEDRGPAEVKGLAYPLATYRVVDSIERLDGAPRRVHARRSNFTLSLDVDAMTPEEIQEAEQVLRDALRHLDAPRKPER